MLQNSVLFAATLACGASALAQTPCDSSARSETLLGGNVGARGVPTIEFDGSPVIGRPFGLWVEDAAPNSLAFVFASTSGAPMPLVDLGAVSHLLPPFVVIVPTGVDGAGRSGRLFDVPEVASRHCGVELFVQAAVLDASAPGSLAITHARRFVFGSAFEPELFTLRGTVISHVVDARLIARGDLDGDGLSDVVVAQSFDDFLPFTPITFSTLLSLGDGTFAPPQTLTVPAPVRDFTLVDVDADGNLDCVTVHQTNGQMRVYLGNGDGTLGAAQVYTPGGGPSQVKGGDVTGDGHVDLLVTNFQSSTLAVFTGDGSGSFGAPTLVPTDAQPLALEIDDVDSDGDLDVVVLAATPRTFTVLRGDGNGGLAPDAPVPVGAVSVSGLESLDFTGDGILDLVVGGPATFGFEGLGDGTYLPSADPELTALGSSFFLTSDDVNDDGRSDLLFGSASAIGYRLVEPGVGLVSSATYHFGEAPALYAPTLGYAFVVHDFDGDGFEDVVAPSNRLLIQRGAPQPAPSDVDEFVVGGNDVAFMRIIDVDGDGLAEVLTSTAAETVVRISHSHPLDDGSTATVDMSELVWRHATADIDGDGRLDLLSVSSMGPGVVDRHVVRLQQADGSFAAAVVNDIVRSQSPVLGHVNSDGVLDVVARFPSNSIKVYFGRSDGGLEPVLNVAVPAGTGAFDTPHLTDVDLDGFDDLVSSGGVALGVGNGTFAPTIAFALPKPSSLRGVESADVDRDGIVDLLLLTNSTTFEFRRGLGSGAFSAPTLTSNSVTEWVAIGDFDGDRYGDIAVLRAGAATELVVHHGIGSAGFDAPRTYFLAVFPSRMAIGDMNGDGIDDVAHSVRTTSQNVINSVRLVKSQLLERP